MQWSCVSIITELLHSLQIFFFYNKMAMVMNITKHFLFFIFIRFDVLFLNAVRFP